MSWIENVVSEFDWLMLGLTVFRILIWLVALWISWLIVRTLIRRFEMRIVRESRDQGEIVTESEKRASTLAKLLQQAVFIALCLTVGLAILRELGVAIGPVLASAGVAGLAIGFGAQNLVRDVISGFFILLENQVRVGDVAIVNGTGGLVEALNFRTMVLRDLAGVVHVFPNGAISTLSNMTKDWSGYLMDVGVAYKEDINKVIEVMRAVGEEIQNDSLLGGFMIEPIEIFGVDSFGDSAVTVKARLKTKPIKQWEIGREYNKRLKEAFDHEGIEIPFPHRSLYFGEASKPILLEIANKLGESKIEKSSEQKYSGESEQHP